MGVVENIDVRIIGQVDADRVNIKRKVMAELENICAKYDLEMER